MFAEQKLELEQQPSPSHTVRRDQFDLRKLKLARINNSLSEYDNCRSLLEREPLGPFCPLDQLLVAPKIPIGATYKLTLEEAKLCIRVGNRRKNNNHTSRRNKSSKNYYTATKFGDQLRMDIQGVIGEYAFCRIFGLPIEIFDTNCRNVDTDTFDATFSNGWKVDVKTSARDDALLLVSMNKARNPPDLYALMIYTNPSPFLKDEIQIERDLPILSFRGFVHQSNILATSYMVKLGSTSLLKYGRQQKDLITLEDIPGTATASQLFSID